MESRSELTRKLMNEHPIAGRRWLMTVILATKEAEISRFAVQSHPQASGSRDPVLKKVHHQRGLVE
jgi:hypothetical protein